MSVLHFKLTLISLAPREDVIERSISLLSTQVIDCGSKLVLGISYRNQKEQGVETDLPFTMYKEE